MRARNDFVIFLEDAPAPSGDLRRIVVEFKNGAPQEKITQDLVKLMCEGTGPGIVGCALMTVYERVTSKTLSSLEKTLTHAIRDAFKPDATTEDSTRHAVEEDSGTGSSETKAERGKVQQSSSWFEFLVLVREGEGQHGLYRAVGSKRRDLNLSDLADRNVCGGISLSPFP